MQFFSRLENEPTEGPLKSVEGWIVFLSNVNDEATEEDIHDKFSAFGNILNLQMPLDRRSGYVKGYAMVEFEKREQADSAIQQMNGTKFMEKDLHVDWAFAIEKDVKLA